MTKTEHNLYSLVMMIWRLAFTLCFTLFMGLSVSHAFYDVPETDPQADIINHLRDVGIMQGFADGNFYPSKTVSRAEALSIALRAGGIQVLNFSGETYFQDVDPNVWYAPVISRAVETNVLSDNYENFRPEQAVTKAEFLSFLFRATKAPLNQYANQRDVADDIPNGEWFTPAFAYAKRFQIAHLPTDNLYYPQKRLNRREVAMMSYRQLRLFHGSENTAQVIELEAAIKQFLSLIKENRYEEAEVHIHTLTVLSDKLARTKNDQNSVGARAISESINHLGDSFRAFRYGQNLSAISSLHLALKQAVRAETKSEAMAPFAQDLSKLIHETLVSISEPRFAQAK